MRIASAVLSFALAATPLSAAAVLQGIDLRQDVDFSTWTQLGSATTSSAATPGYQFSYLVLTTQGSGDQAGAGFAPTSIDLDFNAPFRFDFRFFIPDVSSTRGDGLTFVLATGPALGSGGSGLGYEGIQNSVAFAIDTFHFGPDGDFPGEPESPSLQILQAGSVDPGANVLSTGLGDAIRDPSSQWDAFLLYTPSGNGDNTGTLKGTISHPTLSTFSVSAEVNFDNLGMSSNPIYYGFTASNGAAVDGHWITSTTLAPVPEPETWAMMLAGLALVGWAARSRRG